MNIKEIQKRLDEIESSKDGDEVAHAMEDNLYKDFIMYISENADDEKLKEKARLVLQSGKIEFGRWYA